MTLNATTYQKIMSSKGEADDYIKAHYDRMEAFKTNFLSTVAKGVCVHRSDAPHTIHHQKFVSCLSWLFSGHEFLVVHRVSACCSVGSSAAVECE